MPLPLAGAPVSGSIYGRHNWGCCWHLRWGSGLLLNLSLCLPRVSQPQGPQC